MNFFSLSAIHGKMNQEKPMIVLSTRKDLMIVNMGPHHPSMHGVLRLIVTLDGEDVIDCEPILDIGAQTPFFYIFRERELIYDLFEAATERVEGVGIIGGEEAINWGLSGPMQRASGIQWDLRKVDYYEYYDEFDLEVQWQKRGIH
ncbi:hypothetical protein R6Q59_029434 [Mikania micrantha]